jgi:thiamine pyrophosphate-dependent acetolactate synthase large subunit-like protein
MLMGLGSLATVAAQRPANLAIVVLDNEKYGETGNQATHTAPAAAGPTERGAGTDLAAVARGCGITDSDVVSKDVDIAQLARDARTKSGPVFRVAKVMIETLPQIMPPKDGAFLKDRFRHAVLGAV